MPIKPITIVETHGFAREAEKIWDEAERVALIDHIAVNPQAGVVIPGTSGIRKLRWGRAGSGKRGGARVLYFYHDESVPLFLLFAHTKSDTENIDSDQKRTLSALAAAIKANQPKRNQR